MIDKIKTRMASEQGFTLIELLVVIVILGILVAIAVPSYLSFRGNAAQAAAQANVRSAIPAAEGWYQDPTLGNGTYFHCVGTAPACVLGVTSMLPADLALVAPGISPSVQIMSLNGGKGYCLDSTNGGKLAYYIGGAPTSLGPGVLSTVRSPPMPRARSRLIASPSPIPSWVRVNRVSTCTNGSKIRPSWSAAMPRPVSDTATRALPSSTAQSSEMRPPASVNLIAFVRRLSTIC